MDAKSMLFMAASLGVLDEMPELKEFAAAPNKGRRYFFWDKIHAYERKLLKLAKKEKARRLTRINMEKARLRKEGK